MYPTLIKTVDDHKCSSESCNLKLHHKRCSLYTIKSLLPYPHLLPVLGHEQKFPSNIIATLDSHLTLPSTSKILLQSAYGNETVKCCRRSLKLTSPIAGKEKTKPPGRSSSFALNLIQFSWPWSRVKRSTYIEPRNTDDPHWVIIPEFRLLLKWKCVSSSLHFCSFIFVTFRTNMKV